LSIYCIEYSIIVYYYLEQKIVSSIETDFNSSV